MGAAEEEVMRRLLAGKSAREVKVIGVEALRRWRKAEGQIAQVVQMHGHLGVHAVQLLADAAGMKVDVFAVKELFIYGQQLPFMAPVMDFVWWLFRAGLARPGFFSPGGAGVPAGLVDFYMTDVGVRFLDAGDDHPLAPEFIARLRSRYPDLPDATVVLIEDAQACLEVGLTRTAVVLLGAAYETAVEEVLLNLATKALIEEKAVRRSEAGERIAKLKKLLNKLDFGQEERRLAEAAVDFADHLRVRRNDGVHTKLRWPFGSIDEVEEVLISAGRHLPHLWGITSASPTPAAAPARG